MMKKPIEILRENMKNEGIAGCVIPTGDPHISEYTADYWKIREYYSGFDGSAGTLVVTEDNAGLWTDGRYYVQAAKQLAGSGIKLLRAAEKGCISITDYLAESLTNGAIVYISGLTYPTDEMLKIKTALEEKGLKLCTEGDFAGDLWAERPKQKLTQIYSLEKKYSGKSVVEKLMELRKELDKNYVNAILLGKLDGIAWLFNLRASDIHCTPFFISYAFVSQQKAVLFTHLNRMPQSVKYFLEANGIIVKEYNEVFTFVAEQNNTIKILCDTKEINYSLYTVAQNNKAITIVQKDNPIMLLKAQKNNTEISNLHIAYKQDGKVMVEFYAWLFAEMAIGKWYDEYQLAEKIAQMRKSVDGCIDESFDVIAAYGENAAMCHYAPENGCAKTVEPKGLLLLDNGGQYLNGTTDTTRTTAMGQVTLPQRLHYTLCLKGLIALSTVIFPEGTTGKQLDVLARQSLWKYGLDYRHGTGHGVGYLLSVHEGPHGFGGGSAGNQKLLEGMVVSIEPGYYEQGSHGIRIENVVYVTKDTRTEYGQFYRFETLTRVPLDTDCLEISLLNDDEINWLNSYHQKVYQDLAPLVSDAAKKYLEQKTRPI
ncbi:MAG: aminopeptidase P family protein [Oscillospiraceae bacterium]